MAHAFLDRIDPALVPPPPSMPTWRRLVLVGGVLAFVAIMALAWIGIDMRPMEFWHSRDNIVEFISGFWPESWARAEEAAHDWDVYLEAMLQTVYMALWGSVLAVICSVPLGLLASANIAPWFVRLPIRRFLDALRAINEIVFALMFVTAVGLGEMAGMLALWVHTTGVLAKLFSESVEAIDPRPAEGVRATGAGVLDEINWGVIAQVMPLWISFSLYRFESNVRSATVVGLVGAGGVGFKFFEAMRSFDYPRAGVILIIIVVCVSCIDAVSSRLRKHFT